MVKAPYVPLGKKIRRNFSKLDSLIDIPHLLETSIKSYDSFLYGKDGGESGLVRVFKSVFPVESFSGVFVLEFVNCFLDKPKYSAADSIKRGISYASALYATFRFVIYDKEKGGKDGVVQEVIEQEVYVADIPLMTSRGSFIINGAERVVVAQLHRAPGVFFSHDKGRLYSSGKLLYFARIIPYSGSWLDFEFDVKNNIYVRIDRKRKLPAGVILYACGMSIADIFAEFYDFSEFKVNKENISLQVVPEWLQGEIAFIDIVDKNNQIIVPKGVRISRYHVTKIKQAQITELQVTSDYLIGKVVGQDIVDGSTGEILLASNTVLTLGDCEKIINSSISSFKILYINDFNRSSFICDTLRVSNCSNAHEAMVEIYSVIRPGEPPNKEAIASLFNNLFFNPNTYNLSDVGRMKMNMRLGIKGVGGNVLSKGDIVSTLKTLIKVRNGEDSVDDIDHLGNRRVRSVGEIVERQMRIALSRVYHVVRDRINVAVSLEDNLTPKKIVSTKAVSAVINEFFGSGQLSQFMDQVNPLADIAHKRRISALGPNGLVRERAGFEVRDVHPTHYGRMCPIESPEGQNIGLINSLAIYARINNYGFIESPYRKVVDGKVTDDIEYLSAIEEGNFVIAQANSEINSDGYFADDTVSVRHMDDFSSQPRNKVDYIDVSSGQIVSVAAALIPFLEHDDANRALMGSNMQRQAVPIIKTEKPLVGTGMEAKVALDSGLCVVARNNGIVKNIDASRIMVLTDESVDKGVANVDVYNLVKYLKSNQNTCINQKPIVNVGSIIKKGDILADASSVDKGELALGQNIRVAFMSWHGYNFEDSILLSERLVSGDYFSSVHIQELTCIARDTKLGAEEITADIPNVNEKSLSKLDDEGIVHIGAEVVAGDVLVGKVSPKGEVQLTPEEKLLQAIFGDKASDVKDTSLRLPSSMSGRVIDVQVYCRDDVEKGQRGLGIDTDKINAIKNDIDSEFDIVKRFSYALLVDIVKDQEIVSDLDKNNIPSDLSGYFLSLDYAGWKKLKFKKDAINKKVSSSLKYLDEYRKKLDTYFVAEKDKIINGRVNLVSGARKIIKIYVAVKRHIQAGDKLAGRHGNKGVVSSIMPVEDMPYDRQGNPVDIVLNPLGVPSRMNIGQVLEVHLGAAAKGLGDKISLMIKSHTKIKEIRKFVYKIYGDKDIAPNGFLHKSSLEAMSDEEFIDVVMQLVDGVPMATPVFDGMQEKDIKKMFKLADLPESGQCVLYDGLTGEKFMRSVTVGYMYILKLNHLVDDKMHARSSGSYSLVTQQPLGGKAQFGGQRLGEMEVWALEAYGASYTLHEMLTVKSDDLEGRKNVYKDIVNDGYCSIKSSIPESFNVLSREIRALGLDIDL